jgi:hypothetical protein
MFVNVADRFVIIRPDSTCIYTHKKEVKMTVFAYPTLIVSVLFFFFFLITPKHMLKQPIVDSALVQNVSLCYVIVVSARSYNPHILSFLVLFYLKLIVTCNHVDNFFNPVTRNGALLYFKNLSVFFLAVWRWWVLIYQSEKVILRGEFKRG